MVVWKIQKYPWDSQPRAGSEWSAASRPVLLVDPAVEKVSSSAADLDLPDRGLRTIDGATWRSFELGGTGRRSGGSEDLELRFEGSTGSAQIRLTEGLALPGDGELVDRGDDNGQRTHRFLGRHVELIYGPIEKQGRLIDGCAHSDLTEFFEGWKRSDDEKEPQLALIVRLAQSLHNAVLDIGERPRRVLRRRREMERVGAVRQIDPAGIRWLSRQPGLNLAERAGPRQRVLAVVREESIDTLENRVIRDLLNRSTQECRSWLRDNDETRYGKTARHEDVRRFARLVRRLGMHGELSRIRPVSEIVGPNYVLQHDERYSKIWPWYVKLRRRQQEEDRLWRWSHRTFAEALHLSMAWALDLIQEEVELPQGAGWARSLLLRPEQKHGTFVDPRSDLAGWLVRSGNGVAALTLLQGEQIGAFEIAMGASTRFAGLSPDAMVVLYDPFGRASPSRVLLVWSRVRFSSDSPCENELQSMSSGIAEAQGGVVASGLLIEPGSGEKATRQECAPRAGNTLSTPVQITLLRTPLRAERARQALRSIIVERLLEASDD